MIYDNGQLDVISLFSSGTIDEEYDYSDDDIDEDERRIYRLGKQKGRYI